MKSYEGFGPRMVKESSLTNRGDFTTALDENLRVEPTPYLNRTAISKGTLQTVSGGLPQNISSTGGTVLFTIDPDTGTVTIAGPLQANVSLNLGTINNTTIAGAGTFTGTINNTRLINNGTWNNGTLGTPSVTGGTTTSMIHNTSTIGTPTITGGSHNSAVFGTPTLQRPTIDGTANFDVNTGSATLGASGDFAIQTHSGSAILVVRSGGTTYYFTSAGTL